MSFILDFEWGLWNAWIFMIYLLFFNVFPYVALDKETLKKLGAEMPLSETEKIISNIVTFLIFALIAYSIFLPLKLDTVWFFAGLLIYLLGAIIMALAGYNLITARGDKPVTTGVYSFSRNPGYLGLLLVLGGTGIACLSWVFLLFTTVLLVLLHISVVSEERFCLQKYGDTYREYMERIPRWIGMPRSK
jgi:protein-S-isoprenylcysteine O-methyltransferase Ste14